MVSSVIESATGENFSDQFGITHELVAGHRDQLKPGWSRMLEDEPASPSDAEAVTEMDGVTSRLKLARRVLATFGGRFDVDDALVVGCGDVVEPMFVASAGARSVVGIDLAFASEGDRLTRIADEYLAKNGQPRPAPDTIQLRKHNVANSELPDKSFDLVCSWRTLEHIADPRSAFSEMHRLLKPGGYAYHEYNPFFAIDGGHSLVTLDIPWGHVRFDREDIAAYLNQFRPQEATRALSYFDNCLNRMTIADLNEYATSAGFEILTVIPRTRTEDLVRVDANLLTAAKRNHPTISLNDLISRIVRVVLRRSR
ncbi:MAG: hypothetical protein DHS20C16_20290 [Phycisphaerae bacterium]|nr:MAG: hypothetical protein DHS20C16_20290 [Phycisphaerae bacterium]